MSVLDDDCRPKTNPQNKIVEGYGDNGGKTGDYEMLRAKRSISLFILARTAQI